MNKRIYWSSIEFLYKKQKGNLLGGFVYVFISAFDVRIALKKISNEFILEDLIIKDIEFIKPYHPEQEWDSLERTKHYRQLCEIAEKSSRVEFDTLYAYEGPQS